jgi:hypothetical protein
MPFTSQNVTQPPKSETSIIEQTEPSQLSDVVGKDAVHELPKEIGGRGGLEPTRYGDWEKAGRCIDF